MFSYMHAPWRPPVCWRTVRYKAAHSLWADAAGAPFSRARKARRVGDKGRPDSRIGIPCPSGRPEKGGNRAVNVGIVHLIRARSGAECREAAGGLALVFLLDGRILAAMGRDGICEDADAVSMMLHPGVDENVFLPVLSGRDSATDTIRRLGEFDGGPWRRNFGGKLAAGPCKGRTTPGFSKDEGECMLGDRGAMDTIGNAAGVPPQYKFYKCRDLVGAAHGGPRSVNLNAGRGEASAPAWQGLGAAHGLAPAFLANRPRARAG